MKWLQLKKSLVKSATCEVVSPSDFAPALSKVFLDIQATIECGFTLKRVRDMTRTYSHTYEIWSPLVTPANVFLGRS